MSEHDDRTSEDIGAAIRATTAQVSAPASLRAEVEALRAERRRPRRRLGLRVPALGLAASGAAAALAVAVVLTLGGSSTSGPSLADAATAALRPATGPAPASEPASPALLEAEIDEIHFPQWSSRFGLRASGMRSERLGGRPSVTVQYAGAGGARVGYTIVGTPPLHVPGDARRTTRASTDFAVLHQGGATVVTWRRAGHTCVLASRSVGADRLLALAGWTGHGKISGYTR